MATRKWNPDNLQHGFTDSSELCHWGIKGMKWGVRRFQNKDGSLTPAGKKRYSDDGSKNASKPKQVKRMPVKKVQREVDEIMKKYDPEQYYYNVTDEIHAAERKRRLGLSVKQAEKELRDAYEDEYDFGRDKIWLHKNDIKQMSKNPSLLEDFRFKQQALHDRYAKTMKIWGEVARYVGNTYHWSPGEKTEALMDEAWNKYERNGYDGWSEKDQYKLVREATTIALAELGYPDTPETRKWMAEIVNID